LGNPTPLTLAVRVLQIRQQLAQSEIEKKQLAEDADRARAEKDSIMKSDAQYQEKIKTVRTC